jgi:hypothetical protein
MNDGLRWLLVLGCLCIVFLEAPQDLLLVLQDASGAYPARAPSAAFDAAPLARPSISNDRAPAIDESSAADVVLTGPDVASARPPSAWSMRDTNRGLEEARAHESRDVRTEFRAEIATGR